MSREEHWSELVERTVACPGFRLPTEPANVDGVERALRGGAEGREENPVPGLAGSQSPPTVISEDLPEEDGMVEPEGLSYRGQNSVTGWVFFEEPGRCIEQLPRETGVLLLRFAGPLFEQCGGCHILVFRHGNDAVDHMKLKIQGNADWAWRGRMVLKQAESEVYGKSKEGAKIVGC